MNFSEIISNFRFLQPLWLWVLPLAWWLAWWLTSRVNPWLKVIDPSLLPKQNQNTKSKLLLIACALSLAILALANPAWEKSQSISNKQGQVFVLQLDQSMDNPQQGFPPLVQARFLIEDILQATPGRSSALIAYAEIPFTVTPLTEDQATLLAHLQVLQPNLLPLAAQYTQHPAKALEKAAELLRQAGFLSGEIFLVSQGLPEVTRKKTEQVIEMLQQENIRVSFVYAPGENPQKNSQADQMLIKRHGGLWLSPEKSSMFSQSLSQNTPGQEKNQSTTATWQGRGIFFLLPLLLIVPWFFRRGFFVIFLLLPLTFHKPSLAWSWQDLWQRPDQQQYFSEKENILREKQAIEAYQSENYQQAAEAFAKGQQPESFYNLGNTLAKQGHYEQAIAAYDQALELRPDFAEAIHNRQLLTELLKNQQENQTEESPSEESQSEESQSEESQSEESQSEESQSEESQSEGSQSEESQSEESQSEESQSEESQSEESQSEESQSEESQSEESQSEESQSEESQSEGSQGDESPGNESQGNESQGNELSTDAFQNPGQALSEQERQAAEQAVAEAAQQSTTIAKSARTEGETPVLSDPAALEENLLLEQWLRRIPDDPGLLLQRKFYYQYQQQR